MTGFEEHKRKLHAEVVEKQALHRRLLKAKDADVEPDPADVEAAARHNASPYALFDRAHAPDDY